MERFETISEKVARLLFDLFLWAVIVVVGISVMGWFAMARAQEKLPMAPLTAIHEGNSITIREQPCSFEILSMVQPQYRDLLQGGAGVYAGKPYALCWAKVDESIVFLWEDRTAGRLPVSMFRAQPGI